jgi:hypothetical protein
LLSSAVQDSVAGKLPETAPEVIDGSDSEAQSGREMETPAVVARGVRRRRPGL